jgi:hypothetical protein
VLVCSSPPTSRINMIVHLAGGTLQHNKLPDTYA